MDMTLAQFKSYQQSISVIEKQRLKMQLNIMRLANADDKSYKKAIASLE